jgi:hypothetical protein
MERSLLRHLLLGIIISLVIYLIIRDYVVKENFLYKEDFIIPDVPGYLDWTPNSCPPDKELDGALCYTPCRDGYRGVGPVCWVSTQNVGIGRPMKPTKNCESWYTEPLTCREPITGGDCETKCGGDPSKPVWVDGHWKCDTNCKPIVGGRIKTRLECSDNEDEKDALCYTKCPPGMPHRVPGMPYLCSSIEVKSAADLSYTRDAGSMPNLVKIWNRWSVL